MTILLGLIIRVGQICGIIIVFGGCTSRPKWLKICCGICQILFCLALIWLADM